LKTRAAIIQKVRSFFISKGYLELDTPLLCRDLIPESCLEVFQTERVFPAGSRARNYPLWLIPSPEIWMKKIISRHCVNVFQICKCFRNGESTGHLHNSEFTMLEYYTMDADYLDSLALTEELFNHFTTEYTQALGGIEEKTNNENTREPGGKTRKNWSGKKKITPFKRVTVAESFEKYAGFDLFNEAEKGSGAMAAQARRLGLEPARELTVQQLYDLIFIHAVEPCLKDEKPVALLDYPAFVPCLARIKNRPPRAIGSETESDSLSYVTERWELYHNGIELANCFSEETDPGKVKQFFLNESAEKERSAVVKHKIDHDYYKIFGETNSSRGDSGEGHRFPHCSGTAMGLDRFIMALTGRSSIDSVLPFPERY